MENVLIGLFAADDGKPAARMRFPEWALTASNKVAKTRFWRMSINLQPNKVCMRFGEFPDRTGIAR